MRLLIVVDMQVDFVTGILGSSYAQDIVSNVVEKVKIYLEKGYHVLFTKDTHYDNYLQTREGKYLPVPHCIEGTEGHNLIPELQELYEQYEDQFIYIDQIDDEIEQIELSKKINQFGFNIFDIEEENESDEIFDTIEIIGVATNMCVISVAICFQNIFKNTDIIVDAQCCASFDPELHEKALDVMQSIQMQIINR